MGTINFRAPDNLLPDKPQVISFRQRVHRLVIPALLAASLLAAQAAVACPVPGENPMLIVTLYFGENIPGHAPLTAAEWAAFVAQTITPAFPDGFTVTDGSGQWRDPKTGATDYDPTKVLTVALLGSKVSPATILHVVKAYESSFKQESVGLTTTDACGSF